uniref:N-acyl-phosphatidylethanolamine-hydrolyzing phospholipase D n=1 Tax=Kwoniella pini CBS 10737 TaxID=1296096 RepID=A0A1B9I2A8_9TREE|nr:N-acyl-phosphatidylethanolamine-hydrolyzing phospholipase D [Kwoniella pini CBS 10737]OCF49686.1 N-acyl-phosphatidylethanolamine-hydrolyzing phospholipase D [Kwoniella pini CBS 10737]
MTHPVISLIAPSASLLRDHHGPFQSSRAKPVEDDCSNETRHKPKYFRNPWPSYRTASLKDAYLAYQLGAAIALHPENSPGSSKLKRSRSRSEVNLSYEPDQYELDESDEDNPREEDVSLRAENSTRKIPKKIYVRPELSKIWDDDEIEDWRDPPVEVVTPTWLSRADQISQKEKVTWLGHAGVLVEVPWKGRDGFAGILFDPIFSYRCSPTQSVGPARYLDPPCKVSELPDIHICCISHDHYDHLDYYSIIDLWKYHQSTIHFVVPLGLKQWFTASGIPSTRVTELDWWHETFVSFPNSSPETIHEPSSLNLKIAFTPAQHRSGRGLLDHMTTLWGSWCLGVVEERDKDKVDQRGMRGWEGFKIFFGGDTGYRYATAPEGDDDAICPAFKEIASHYSPFDLSLLPLSTGSSLPFLRTMLSLSLDQYTLTSSLHCSPQDSLEIHRILESKRTLGIHWGTFCDEDESRGTRVDFGRSRRSMGISGDWNDEGCFVVGDIGETFVLL